MKTTLPIVTAVLAIAATQGCASGPPPRELLDARAEYTRAMTGPAHDYRPADLEAARQSLQRAEDSYASDPGSQSTTDLAYIAYRKVLVAEARGRIAGMEKGQSDSEAQFKTEAQAKVNDKNTQLQNEGQQLTAEEAARQNAEAGRQAAEARAKDALERLSALAAVKQDTRGTVITLSGSVLFATNKSDLLPGASERLNQVAEALQAQPDKKVTIFGYTDSQGDASYNMTLSDKRAASVRQYLVDRGVDSSRIRSMGKGKADPVADNATAEGRANNRRVEIVLATDTQQ
jgi:outer membrane protein OmpA-like peptidoglycan-associated protein